MNILKGLEQLLRTLRGKRALGAAAVLVGAAGAAFYAKNRIDHRLVNSNKIPEVYLLYMSREGYNIPAGKSNEPYGMLIREALRAKNGYVLEVFEKEEAMKAIREMDGIRAIITDYAEENPEGISRRRGIGGFVIPKVVVDPITAAAKPTRERNKDLVSIIDRSRGMIRERKDAVHQYMVNVADGLRAADAWIPGHPLGEQLSSDMIKLNEVSHWDAVRSDQDARRGAIRVIEPTGSRYDFDKKYAVDHMPFCIKSVSRESYDLTVLAADVFRTNRLPGRFANPSGFARHNGIVVYAMRFGIGPDDAFIYPALLSAGQDVISHSDAKLAIKNSQLARYDYAVEMQAGMEVKLTGADAIEIIKYYKDTANAASTQIEPFLKSIGISLEEVSSLLGMLDELKNEAYFGRIADISLRNNVRLGFGIHEPTQKELADFFVKHDRLTRGKVLSPEGIRSNTWYFDIGGEKRSLFEPWSRAGFSRFTGELWKETWIEEGRHYSTKELMSRTNEGFRQKDSLVNVLRRFQAHEFAEHMYDNIVYRKFRDLLDAVGDAMKNERELANGKVDLKTYAARKDSCVNSLMTNARTMELLATTAAYFFDLSSNSLLDRFRTTFGGPQLRSHGQIWARSERAFDLALERENHPGSNYSFTTNLSKNMYGWKEIARKFGHSPEPVYEFLDSYARGLERRVMLPLAD